MVPVFSFLDLSHHCSFEGPQTTGWNPIRGATNEVREIDNTPSHFKWLFLKIIPKDSWQCYFADVICLTRYRIDFRSSNPVGRLHAFVSPGEVKSYLDYIKSNSQSSPSNLHFSSLSKCAVWTVMAYLESGWSNLFRLICIISSSKSDSVVFSPSNPSSVQITLVKDLNKPPPPARETGRLVAMALNAVDGKTLSIGAKVTDSLRNLEGI